jgi:hypothetical protein
MPLMLLNFNRERIVPSATELPSWEPQHASLYNQRVLEEANVGEMASSYASVSVEGEK